MEVDTVIRRRPDMAHSAMGEEVIILSQQTSRYLGLDGVGARIWELLEEPKTIGQLRDAIHAEYDVDEEELLSDLRAFILQLSEKQILEIEGAP